MTSEKLAKEYEAGMAMGYHQPVKFGSHIGAGLCLLIFFLDVATYSWNIGELYISSEEFLPHDLKTYFLFFLLLAAVGALLVLIYAVGFFTTLHSQAFSEKEWHIFNAITNSLMLGFDFCIVIVYWKAHVCKDCVIADRVLSVAGATSLAVTMIGATLRLFLYTRYSGGNEHFSKAANRIILALLICLFLATVASGLLSFGKAIPIFNSPNSASDRPVFLVHEAMPFCYEVERKVAAVKGVEYILPPPKSVQEEEEQQKLRSVYVSCCRFYQKAYVASLQEIINASPLAITRRVRCQDAFHFMNYLLFPDHMHLLETHDCTLVIKMRYERARASLMYNSGLEFRSKTDPLSCLKAGSNLDLEYSSSATKVTKGDALQHWRAVGRYECPHSENSCPRLTTNNLDQASTVLSSIQPKDLTSHINCYTSANLTQSLDLGLCQGPPQVPDPQPYPTLTSCIDDYEEIEAGPYLAYGTH